MAVPLEVENTALTDGDPESAAQALDGDERWSLVALSKTP
jgi:hypothetical protein